MQQTTQDMTDGECVLRAANDLEVSEFEIFRRAYNDWFEKEVDIQLLKRDFAQYMYFGSAPPWVLHYTHMIMEPPHAPTGTYASRVSRLMGSRLGQYLRQ